MIRLVIISCLFTLASLHAREGVVRTLDGQVLEGHVRFESAGVLVANPRQDFVVTLAVTNIAVMFFERDSPQPNSRPTPEPEGSATAAEGGELPAPWQSHVIDGEGQEGRASFRFGLFKLFGRGGAEMPNGQEDAVAALDGGVMQFVHKPVQGDSEIAARVIAVQSPGFEAAGGLVFRAGLDPNAPFLALSVAPEGGGAIEWRRTQGARVERKAFSARQLSIPVWLRLKREADRFTAYRSSNGRRWTLIDAEDLPMKGTLQAGVASIGLVSHQLPMVILDQVRESVSLESHIVPRIELTSGSVIPGRLVSVTDDGVKFVEVLTKPEIPLGAVSRILFGWVPWALEPKARSLQSGVLLTNGEFVAGQFRGITGGRVTINSILFGQRSFDVNQEVLAVLVKPSKPRPPPYEVETTDGTRWKGQSLSTEQDYLVISEPAIGPCRIPVFSIDSVWRPR